MAFTDQCDLFGAVHENGVNLIVGHIMRQRPSLFNYATQDIRNNLQLACAPVDHTSDVDAQSNPLFHLQDPLPLFGVDAPPVGLDYCVQVTKVEVDFFPSNVIQLPQELNPPLADQHMSFHVKVCGGIDCPSLEIIDGLPIGEGSPFGAAGNEGQKQVVPRPRKLLCFCVDAFAVAHVEIESAGGDQWLVGKVDAVDIVDIQPGALEENLNCYLRTMFEALLREKLAIDLNKLFLDITKNLKNKLVKVSFSLSPDPPIPNNPAVEDDQVKAFLHLKVAP